MSDRASVRIRPCEPGGEGLVFPLTEAEQDWPNELRVVLYGAAMIYLFLGVNIVSDKFMTGIEMIRSKKMRMKVKEGRRPVTVTLWNPTVANLTLMALGSSAPEILLSIVEIIRNEFYEGDLGPSTIVGSAAFNLFVIVAVCILTIPSTEVRKIKELGVYWVTAIFSLSCYFWMLFIVKINSPDVVELWEACATLGMFPVLIFISYLADIGWLSTAGRQGESSDSVFLGRVPKLMAKHSGSFDEVTHAMEMKEDDSTIRHLEDGRPMRNPRGVLTFESDTLTVDQGLFERQVLVPVHRRNGTQGTVACSYSMEPLTAMPDYDYRHAEGELRFAPGQARADITIELLPKKPGERDDSFQIILSDPQGGAIFNPHLDGASQDRCLMTVTIRNEDNVRDPRTISRRAVGVVDSAVNLDRLRLGSVTWYEDIVDAVRNVSGEDSGSSSVGDWIIHIVSLPWKVGYAVLVPPPIYCGGWLCFIFALLHIAILTAFIIDFAELFGCVLGIQDSITAITFVALGTSMPDLFASITAAVQDETADASIINVTGSNSVNVFLGIGLPWTIAGVYWAVVGPTEQWKALYADFLPRYPNGAFVVRAGNLSFSVGVFSLGACIALGVIGLRRYKFGGELGGPLGWKVASFMLMVMFWVMYIALSVWQTRSDADLAGQVIAVCIGLVVVENALLVFGLLFWALWQYRRWRARSAAGSSGDDDAIEDLPAPEEPSGPPAAPRGPRDPAPCEPDGFALPADRCFEQPP